ncbi:MAG: nucleotidyltransferase family protein [Gemmatimonadaceae bacterium]|jgi:hypothetical protein|nr:nucleotidyltransferase family protein [Gemmatimonadaceae bacterium]
MTGGLWPTPEQTLLLRAALGTGDEAEAAFRQWQGVVDVESEFGWSSVRLLPLVYRSLQQAGSHDPLMGRLKGVYRRMWAETHQRFQRVVPTLRALRDAGVEVLLLKGAPLVLTVYRNHALRPMSDVDLCVRSADVALAMSILEREGWALVEPWGDGTDRRRYTHAAQYRHPEGGEIDLHWHVLAERLDDVADAWFWASVEPLDFCGVGVWQLDPTRQLLHTIVHGVRWNPEPPIRWIADATALLATHGAVIDWDALCTFAAASRVSHRTGLGLRYLRVQHGAPVPAAVFDRLGERHTWIERLEETVWLRDFAPFLGVVGNQWTIVVDHVRISAPQGIWRVLTDWPHYWRYRLGLGGRRELGPAIVRAIGRRLGGRRGAAQTDALAVRAESAT